MFSGGFFLNPEISKRFFMIQKTCFLIFSVLALIIFSSAAYANGGLFFAPTRVNLSDKNPVSEIRVTNTSSIAKAYTLELHDMVMTEEGKTARVDSFDYSAKRMIRFVPRQFDLQPGQKQTIRLMSRIPSETPDGEFHTHMEFLENVSRRQILNQEEGVDSRAKMMGEVSYATSIPLTLSKGDIVTNLDITDLALQRDEKGKPSLSMVVRRSGNGQGNALIETDYIAPDGTVTKAGVRRKVYVYREIDARNHSFVLELLEGVTLQKGGMIKLRLFNKDKSEKDPVRELTLAVN